MPANPGTIHLKIRLFTFYYNTMENTFHTLWATLLKTGFPCGSAGNESAHNAGDLGSIPGSGRSPGEGNGYTTPVFWPGDFHGLYPWARKESDPTEPLSLLKWLLHVRHLMWSSQHPRESERHRLGPVRAQSLPAYATLRPSLPAYATLRPSLPAYATLRPSLPAYSTLRPRGL